VHASVAVEGLNHDGQEQTPDRLRVEVHEADPGALAGLRGFLDGVRRQLRLRSIGTIVPPPGTRYSVTATAYASNVSQTDDTPCVTAAQTRVRRGVVATNFLPLGTRLQIGDEIFVVEDRMNSRYNGKYIIDIWFPSTELAVEHGARLLEIEIIGYGPVGEPIPSPEVAAEPATAPSTLRDRLRSVSTFLVRFIATRVPAIPDTPCPAS
jgi:3D (Asp-Asp-Asp) domain-containing protein